jgi:hypothetical protein
MDIFPMIRQIKEEIMKCKWGVCIEKSKLKETERSRDIKCKFKSIIIIFFMEWIVHKEFILAGQTVSSTYYGSVVRRLRDLVRRLFVEFWLQKNCLLHHDNALPNISVFTREFLTKETVNLHPSYSPDVATNVFSVLPSLKIVLLYLR